EGAVGGGRRDPKVVGATVLLLEATIPSRLAHPSQPFAQRPRRQGLPLIQERAYVVHYQHARRQAGQIIEPSRAVALHHDQRLPRLTRKRLQERTRDVAELQVLEQRISRTPRPVPREVVHGLGHSAPRGPHGGAWRP